MIDTDHSILKLVNAAATAGIKLGITSKGTLQATGNKAAIKELAPALKVRKQELIDFFDPDKTKGEHFLQPCTERIHTSVSAHIVMPYLKDGAELVIPLNVADKYRWWQKGQSILDTLLELDAPDSVIDHWIGEITSSADWHRWQKIMKEKIVAWPVGGCAE